MAAKFFQKVSNAILIGMAGYEIGSRTSGTEAKPVEPVPIQADDKPDGFGINIAMVITMITMLVVLISVMLAKACKCAHKVLKAVETNEP